jgi:predicted  nucleic acid-binding Zn-ribbon protein
MAGPAEVIREIHRLRRFLQDLQGQIDRAPAQQRAQQAKVARQEEGHRQAQEAIKRLKVEAHSKEVALRSTHGQIARHREQFNKAGSTKEYEALRAELNAEEATARRLEDEILAAMEEAEQKTAEVPELEAAVRRAKEEYARFEQTAGERLAGLRGHLAEAEQQLEAAETQIPESVRGAYDRVVAARGADAMAALQGRTCSACYTEITAQQYNELLQQLFVVCKACGRILYLPA